MGKIKILTVQFDVTHLSDSAIATLQTNLEVQGEEFDIVDENGEETGDEGEADLLNSGVRELNTEDV